MEATNPEQLQTDAYIASNHPFITDNSTNNDERGSSSQPSENCPSDNVEVCTYNQVQYYMAYEFIGNNSFS